MGVRPTVPESAYHSFPRNVSILRRLGGPIISWFTGLSRYWIYGVVMILPQFHPQKTFLRLHLFLNYEVWTSSCSKVPMKLTGHNLEVALDHSIGRYDGGLYKVQVRNQFELTTRV